MNRPFVKLHGLGNDFIFFDALQDQFEIDGSVARALCDRHMGIGGDGVILVKPSPRSECPAFMHYYNSDGTEADMCGNGVRCFAKYLVDREIVDPSSGVFVADTPAGPREIHFEVDDDRKLRLAQVDMGKPIFYPPAIPVNATANGTHDCIGDYVKALRLDSPWGPFTFTCVSMGNPHAVCFIDDWSSLPAELFADGKPRSLVTFDVTRVGAFFESHEAFPLKTNVEFATCGPNDIEMRVYERGCGETLACGTGACATLVSAVLLGRSKPTNTVRLLGGALQIQWYPGKSVLMTGSAAESFTGEVDLTAYGWLPPVF